MNKPMICVLGLVLGTTTTALAFERPALVAPAETYGELKSEFDQALSKWYESFREANDEERAKLGETHPARAFWARFEVLATGGDAGSIVWLVENLEMSGVPTDEVGDAALPWLETLVYDHRESDAFADGLDQLSLRAKAIGVKRARTLFEAAVSETKRRKNKAHAIVGLGDLLADQPGEEAKARELLELAIAEYDDTAAGERAVELLKGLALRPGKPAPNFEAATVDGHAFQLSDYEGKVVLLDFYGFW